jgi:tetratricopeptide (TPR) repeat protein
VLEKWPFVALALASAVLAIVGQHATGAVVALEQLPVPARIAQAFYGLAFYVHKTIWPSDLMVFYPMRVPLDTSAIAFVIPKIAFVIAVPVLVRLRRRAPAAGISFASYALLVAPVLGLVQTGSQLVADRYSYASSIPLCLLAGGAVLLLARARLGRVAFAIAGACLVPLALATRAQIGVWHDTESLWRHDLAIDPDDHPARRSLIVAYLDQGRASRDPKERAASLQRALDECENGMRIGPDAAYLMNAAKVYDLRADDAPPGHDAERRRDLEIALEKAREGIALAERTLQRFPDVYETTGVILCKLERTAEAVPFFEKLVALDAMNAARWGMLAEAHRAVGHRDAAIAAYQKLIEAKEHDLGDAAERDEDVIAARSALAELGVKR